MIAMGYGQLWLVATPIGNLEDLSPRAVSVLKHVNAIACEDTRHSGPLLAQFGIATPTMALHEHNEREFSDKLVLRMQAGESIALISDAGTPLVSDPGFRLVRAAIAAGIVVTAVPGPSALIVALCLAGFATDRFVFEGFLSAKSSARKAQLQELSGEPRTLIFYESKHRLFETLDDLVTAFGGTRQIAVARELTKQYETVLRGDLQTVRSQIAADDNQQRGEFVLVVEGATIDEAAQLTQAKKLYQHLLEELPPARAAKLAAKIAGVNKKQLYGSDAAGDQVSV